MAKELVKRIFGTNDIVKTILDCDQKYRSDSDLLPKGYTAGSTRDQIKRVFDFVKNYIKYQEDPRGEQFVQRPATLLKRRVGDCKSMSLLSGSMLYKLEIPYQYRFVSYDKPGEYTHVYVIASDNDKKVIVDPVYGKFDQEDTPIIDKIDIMPQGLYMGSKRKRIGALPTDAQPLYDKWLPPVTEGLDKLRAIVVQNVRPNVLPGALLFINKVKQDVQDNPRKLLIYNSHSNHFLAGNTTWDQYVKALAATLVYQPPASVDGFGDFIKDAFDTAGDFLHNTADAAGNVFHQFTDWAGNTVSNAADAAKSAKDYVANKATKVALSVSDAVGDFVHDPIGTIKEAAKTAWYILKKATLSLPRNAFLLLVRFNFHGFADSLLYQNTDEVNNLWRRLGGDVPDLRNAIDLGHKEARILGSRIGAEPVTTSAAITKALVEASTIIAAFEPLLGKIEDVWKNISPQDRANGQQQLNQFYADEANAAAQGDQDAFQSMKKGGIGWVLPTAIIGGALVWGIASSGGKTGKKRK